MENGKDFVRCVTAPSISSFHKLHVRKGPYSVHRFESHRLSSPNISGQVAAAIGRVVSSVFNASEFHCEIYMDDPRAAVTHQSRCWPSPSSWCGASECSMVSTVVKPLSATLFSATNQFACMSRCLPQITLLLPTGLGSVFRIWLAVNGISRVS